MLIARLLGEIISMQGVGLTAGVGRSWLLGVIVERLDGCAGYLQRKGSLHALFFAGRARWVS